jgi:hypothetical protein
MNTCTVESWQLESTFNKLMMVGSPKIAEDIAVLLDIPLETLIDMLRAHDCGDFRFADYPAIAYRSRAQAVFAAIIGMLDIPPQVPYSNIVEACALDTIADVINLLRCKFSAVLKAEVNAVKPTGAALSIRQRLRELDTTIAFVARRLNISRTTLYAYIRSYEAASLEHIPNDVKNLLDRIACDPGLTESQLAFILSKISHTRMRATHSLSSQEDASC